MKSKYFARKRTSVLVYFTIFIYLLMQMRCWIGFSGRTVMMQYVLVALLAIYGLFGAVRYQFRTKYIVFSLLYFIYLLYAGRVWEQNIFGLIGRVIPAVNALFILSIPDDDKEIFLGYIIKWLGWILLPSMALYLILQFASLPNLGVLLADYGSKIVDKRVYYNYIFYILPSDLHNYGFTRFNGPFLEAGDVGCVTAFLLFATQFDFKRFKFLRVIAAALIVSFSLAGWVLAVIGYALMLFSKKRVNSSTIVLFIIVLLVGYLFASFYNGGDNAINNLILSRLESDEVKIIAGNNRINVLIMDYFLGMFGSFQTAMFGYDSITVDIILGDSASVGFMPIAIRLGLLGIILNLLPYLAMTQNSISRRYGWAMFFILALYFIQRTETFWIVVMISYVYGIVINDRKNKKAL